MVNRKFNGGETKDVINLLCSNSPHNAIRPPVQFQEQSFAHVNK